MSIVGAPPRSLYTFICPIVVKVISVCAPFTPFIKLFMKMYIEMPKVTLNTATMSCLTFEVRCVQDIFVFMFAMFAYIIRAR